MSSFTVVPNNSGEWARKGKLIVREQTSVLETPNFILETNFGIPPFLTPDHLLSFFPLPIALSVQLTQFYEQLPNIEKWKKGGLREYIGLEEINKVKEEGEEGIREEGGEPLKKKQKKEIEKQSKGVFLFLSCNNERTGEQLPSKSENIQLITPTGRKPLTTKLWNSILSNLQPNFALSPYPEFDSFSSKKRIQKAVAQSSDFFQKTIKTFHHPPQTPANIKNNNNNNNNNNNGEVKQNNNNEMIIEEEEKEEVENEWKFKGFAPLIIGHPVELERKKSAKLFTDFISTEGVNGKVEITGVSLHGLGKGENPADRSSILRSALEQVSASFARLVTGLGNPLEIIKGVKDGIDLFTINFPVLITEANSALIFDLLPSSSPSVQVINLSNTKYIRDWSLLSDNCHCFTCSRKYTKAYLNHLINTHELLVSTLLNMHNIYHYIQFFQVIRKKIEEGTFGEYAHWFEQYWSLPLSS